VSDEGSSIAAGIEPNGSIAACIAFMSKKLSRKGVAELEKLATAVYVNRKYGSDTPIERRAEILVSLKPHVSVEAARDAFAEAETVEDEARDTVLI
jgi:hypothetical protein